MKKRIGLLAVAGLLWFAGPEVVQAAPDIDTNVIVTAAEIYQLSEQDRVDMIGALCQKDYQDTRILASVSAAQCILESAYLESELAVNANNCFGMKVNLSGNNWEGSSWDGQSSYAKRTSEEVNGSYVSVTADFRSYSSIQQSIQDHSAYLLGATSGNGLRYYGLQGEMDYRTAVQIIKDGGYATDSSYVDKVCGIIEKYNLTKFDVIEEDAVAVSGSPSGSVERKAVEKPLTYDDSMYRIRKEWKNVKTQIGLYPTLRSAEKACKEGFKVFDSKGKEVYAP